MKVLKYTDKWLLILSVILFLFGLVMIFSASNIAAFMRYADSPYKFLMRQSTVLIVGVIASLVIIHFNTKAYNVISWFLVIGISAALIALLLYGTLTNKARSWFPIGSFNFQPSEFAKVIMIVWMSGFYELRRKSLGSWFTSLFPLLIAGAIFVLIALQPDWGTGFIFAAIIAFIFTISQVDLLMKVKTVGIVLLVGGALFIGFLSSEKDIFGDRQNSRLDFGKPCSEEKFYTNGNQVCNAYIAMNNGGLFGRGLGNSTQKYLYLPEAHTDFIFAIVVEELGFVTGAGLILLFFLTIVRIIHIGRKSISSRGAMFCYGIAFYIFTHIVVNLLGVMGLMPITGIPLPFMSYGGSFSICLIAALTIVQRVAIETKLNDNLRKSER